MASCRSCWSCALSVVSVMAPVSHRRRPDSPALEGRWGIARRACRPASVLSELDAARTDCAETAALRGWRDGPLARTALRAVGWPRRRRCRRRRVRRRSWSARGSTCAGSPCPPCRPGRAPVRILQVSDLHLTPGQAKKIAWVRVPRRARARLRRQLRRQPRARRRGAPAAAGDGAALGASPARSSWAPTTTSGRCPRTPPATSPGAHAEVRGGAGPTCPVGALVDGLREGGWADLDNARTVVTMGDHDVELVGVDDPHIGYDRYAAVSGPAADDVALTMGLVHAPYQRVLDAMVADGASVVLAGHTHGGQLALPVWGALVTNCDLDTRRAKGLSRWWPGAGRAGPCGRCRAVVRGTRRRGMAARLSRARDLSLRSGALRVPARGDPAHPRGPRRAERCGVAKRRTRSGLRHRDPVGRFRRARPGRLSSGVAAPLGSAALPRGVAQLGSARRSGRRGRRFKSCHPDQWKRPL